ncbi:MAG TPA: S-methyl-5-thioribose-1-phosphate isomerase [bacterium]|nr:S-methyl-5-thioribose-1-phosphate isomerase [bacterium]
MKPFIKTLWWENNRLFIIDQRKLPALEKTVELKTVKDVWNAVKTLKIRGAPAIGCAAAYGIALCAVNSEITDCKLFKTAVKKNIEYMAKSRPTARNLFFALERMTQILKETGKTCAAEIKKKLAAEAERIYREDLECCYKIGVNGAKLIRPGMNILTHCNAGALATSGFGTALAPFFIAKKKGMQFHVFVDETRPVLQGARLTAWELEKAGVPYTLICDNMAGYLMQQGKIDMVITGADRIASNGDAANKIGTYSLAVLAHYHKIPFYIAAPYSTFDKNIKTGRGIVIEERAPEEVKQMAGKNISPTCAKVYNPAFDITPAKFIKAFITENGIIKKL